MTLAELGMLLRGERVRCGYSADEVASRLKITSRVVRSIEEGDLDGLPHAVYAGGFIRAYATLVGVGEEEIRSALQELVSAEEQSAQQVPVVPPSVPSSSLRLLIPLVLLLLLAGLGYGLYVSGVFGMVGELSGVLNKASTQATPAASRSEPATKAGGTVAVKAAEKSSAQAQASDVSIKAGAASVTSTAPAPVSAPPVVTTTPATPGAGPLAPSAVPAPAVAAAPTTPALSEADPVRTSGFTPVPAAALKPATTDTITLQNGVTPGKVEQAGQGKNQIILTGLEECWVHSSADGTDIRQFSIKKGDVFALSFGTKLVLKLGNAGGVQIKYNGQQLPAQGTSGQVKTLTFPLAS